MKFSYKFQNLLGTVYNKGDLNFTPQGDSVVSPVGNRITVFDLKNNKSCTLPFESQLNITSVAVSPCGKIMICVCEDGQALLINMLNGQVIQRYHFHAAVKAISFSPDGKYFAVTKETKVLLFNAPQCRRQFNPFSIKRTLFGAYDDNVSIDWTSDSKAICVGSADMNTRVYGVERFSNLVVYSMGGHRDSVVAAFFEHNSLDVYSISGNGQLCVWEADTDLDGLTPYVEEASDSDSDSDDESSDAASDEDLQQVEDIKVSKLTFRKRQAKEDKLIKKIEEKSSTKVKYVRSARHDYKSSKPNDESKFARVTSATYHKKMKILVAAFDDGSFFLHEMPDFNLIHSLCLEGGGAIASLSFNPAGDWLALGGEKHGQLVVWEWQSESFTMKQQGHYDSMHAVAYSPDGLLIATGADDGKVKLWDTSSGFCFVTFKEHKAAVTAVEFVQSGKAILTSSLDGTVRAFDTTRYRNFRTFTTPRPTQFSCLAVDRSGEIVCAGGHDVFEVFVWSMKTGRLLEILAGHEGPISGLSFNCNQSMLASSSWDKTVKLWDVFENKGSKETLTLGSDALAVAFRPDGKQLCISTLNCHITFWDVSSGTQTGSIEGRRDLGYSRADNDRITAKSSSKSKAFTTICYSADGNCLLAGGNTRNICIYSIADQMLLRRFEISCNLSLDGTQEFLDRRKMTEWGSLALVDEDDDGTRKDISLPGVKKGDMSSRHWKPQVRVTHVTFSPTGREWVATTTEGLMVYALDSSLVFNPYDFALEVTPQAVLSLLEQDRYVEALQMALRLNEHTHLTRVLQRVPIDQVEYMCQFIKGDYVIKLLNFLATSLEKTKHIQFYIRWIKYLLFVHGRDLKKKSSKIQPVIHLLQRNISKKQDMLSKACHYNKYNISYITAVETLRKSRPEVQSSSDEDEEMRSCHSDSEDSDNMDMSELVNNFSSGDSE